MAADLGGGAKKGIVDINITPFVDIILVVLIIFMVTSTVVATKKIPVDLPDAATGESADPPTSVALVISEAGVLHLDGKPSTEQDVRDRLRSLRDQDEDVVCLIGADRSVDHGEVVGLIDLVRQEGVSRFALDIDPVPLPEAAL